MRRLTVGFCLVLLWTGLAWSAATVVQSRLSVGTVSESSRALAFSSSVTAGSTLVALCTVLLDTFSTSDATFSDTLTNTWTTHITVGINDPEFVQDHLYMGSALTGSTGANTITCDPPGAGYITLVIVEIAGLTPVSPVDQLVECDYTCSGVATTGVSTGTTGTTSQADELLIRAMTYAGTGGTTMTETAPCTLLQEHENWDTGEPINVCYDIVSSIGTFARAWTLGTTDLYRAGAMMTLKIAAAAAAAGRRLVIFP